MQLYDLQFSYKKKYLFLFNKLRANEYYLINLIKIKSKNKQQKRQNQAKIQIR